jgi:alpha-glucosidase
LAAISPDAWPCNTLGNHDSPRVKNRYGDGMHDDALARLHLALMLTLRGTPFLYNGEEIGMTDLALQDISQFRDLLGMWIYHAVRDDLKAPAELAFQRAAEASRDKSRTPLQWANEPNGGFSPAGVPTWLPINPNFAQGVNVAEQQSDPGSLLNFYRGLLRLRKGTLALTAGDYTPLHEDAVDYLAFLRHVPAGPEAGIAQTCLVILNFADHPLTLRFDLDSGTARRFFSSSERDGKTDDLSRLSMEPLEIYIGELIS